MKGEREEQTNTAIIQIEFTNMKQQTNKKRTVFFLLLLFPAYKISMLLDVKYLLS